MSGTLVVSLDFELFWGMLDCGTLESYQDNVLGGKKAIPQLLSLFEKYEIHATWATVGFLFGENYAEVEKYFPDKEKQPAYINDKLDAYSMIKNNGKSELEAPCFYAPGLVAKIANTRGQEIASHTFSHYYCKEKGQTIEQFEADMRAALKIANQQGYNLTSVVFPRNQCTDESVEVLKKMGFTAYRARENDWIHTKIAFNPLMKVLRLLDVYFPLTGQGGYVIKNDEEIVNVRGSRMYKPYRESLAFLEKRKVKRIKKQMLNAAKKNLTFHLWWHPHNIGVKTEYHLKQLEDIFQYYIILKNKYNMQSLNMQECSKKPDKITE